MILHLIICVRQHFFFKKDVSLPTIPRIDETVWVKDWQISIIAIDYKDGNRFVQLTGRLNSDDEENGPLITDLSDKLIADGFDFVRST